MATAAKQLYQLVSKNKLPDGAYVAVNGPHDRWGVILSSAPNQAGGFLNQIRGCSQRKGEKPVAQF